MLANLPGSTGVHLRRFYVRRRLGQCGAGLFLGCGGIVKGANNISLGDGNSFNRHLFLSAEDNGEIRIGNNVNVNCNVHIDASCGGRIEIGNDVLIAQNVVIRASNHAFRRADIPIRGQGHQGGRIIIEDDVWIGANCVICPDIRIGRGAVIGAGSVVTKDIEPFEIAGGVPARRIKLRNEI